jgi:hypothetical protein
MGTFEAAQKAGKSDEKQVTKTKRQRRKDQQKSDKNKWLIQHPKIQSMDRREKIYVKDAGLNETKAEKRQAPIDPKLDLMSPEVKFGRILAGTDQRKRHAAVKKLKAYLKARCDISEVVDGDGESSTGGISELDLLKLWKALWYTLYMADKKPVQDELSKHICKLLWCVVGTEEEDEYAGRAYLEMTEAEEQELMEGDDDDEGEDEDLVTLEEIENTLKAEMDSNEGEDEEEDDKEKSDENEDEEEDESADMMEFDDSEIPHCRGAHLVSIFVRTFFRTIRRDWGSMDKYRIDKFYTLIRHMMHEVYEYMSTRSWNYGIILLLNDAIFEEILKQPPNGLRYHLIDLCLEELAKVNAKAKIALTEATFLDVLEPFFGLCQTGRNDDTVQGRVMEKVLDNFLEKYSVISDKALEEENDNTKEDSLIFSNVHVKTIAEFLFTLGSDPDTKDRYRKSLYDLHKKYMRRLKKIGKDVEIATDEDGNEVYEDEDEDAGVDDVNLNNIDESIRFLESETNGDVENDSDDDLRDGDENDQDEEEEEKVEIEKPKVESKKKKRKSIEREADEKPKAGTDNGKDGKRKKKRKSLEALEEGNAPDEEVVITLTEQQDAKKKDRKAKKKLKEQAEEGEKTEDDSADNDSRRVSFRKKNRAKSHKASMKALRTSEPPSTKETAPAKGILRMKPRHSSGVVTKKVRKKATSYF